MALGSTITQVTESGIKPGITWPSFVSSGVATATNFKTGTTDVHDAGVTAATVVVGSAVTGNSTGLDVTGIVTATTFAGGTFTGDGSSLTGVASTEYIHSSTNAVLSGIVTTGPLNSSTGNFSSNVTISGNLGVAGTITYEDVARVDATGISTFREGFGVGPLAGIALTAYNDGSIRTSGIVTASSFVGNGNVNCTSGRFQRGSATVQDGDAIAGGININGTDMDASVIMSVFGNDGDFTRISGSKSRNASVGSHTIVQNNDVLLSLKGFGSDGTNFEEAAQIEMQVDGSPGNDDMPGRIVFKTTADGASSPTERVRITSTGKLGVNTTAPVENVGIAGSMRFVTANGTRRMITALPSGNYATSVSGGSAIGFERIADGGGGSDEIYFETHWQGNRHGESMRINKQGYVTTPNQVFFSVYGTGSNQTYNDGDIITFENAKENIGSHFKMTSGTGQYQRFIAPVAGVYIFTFGFFPNSASNCRIQLAVDGSNQTNPYISGCFTAWGTGVGVPMGTQMLKLGANSYVDVRVTSGSLTNTYDGHTGFQGFLLG